MSEIESYLRYAGHGDVADCIAHAGIEDITMEWILKEGVPKSNLVICAFMATYFNIFRSLW